MEDKIKISAFTIVSEPERLCYPYIESIKSWLPLVDELIVVHNCLPEFQDDSYEKIESLDPKVKIIDGLFDYERFGWASQGIMRTNGYYACTGDIVIMFDCDGLLHENDVEPLRNLFNKVQDKAYGYFMKHRIFKPDTLIRQCKHSGWFNKRILGNNFNFYGKSLYAPNWGMIPKEHERGQQLDIYVWGYERIFDTREVFFHKLRKRRIMETSAHEVPSESDYITNYLNEVEDRMNREHKVVSINDHPQIIQDKLKEITKDMFGYNHFNE